MTLLAWTHMLYSADATVRVLTDPAFLLVMATMMACTYGAPTSSMLSVYRGQWPTFFEIVSKAMSNGRTQI